MTHTRTFHSVREPITSTFANFRRLLPFGDSLRVTGRLDYRGLGAHVVWTAANDGREPLTLTQLVLHGSNGSTTAVEIDPNIVVKPRGRVRLATELDWNVLTARSMTLTDSDGTSHRIRHRALARVRKQLRQTLHSPPPAGSAGEWLYGTANMAFGVVILGLGLFMLLWVIATG